MIHDAAALTPLADSPIPLRGRPPARDDRALVELMHAAGMTPLAVASTAAWLDGEKRASPSTRASYVTDLGWWLHYLHARGLDPADVHPLEADRYAAALRAAGLADSTRARRLAAVSSWYRYLVRAGAAQRNPLLDMERPAVEDVSKTRSLSKDELDRMLAHSRQYETARTYALLCLLVVTACRVGGVVAVGVDALGYDKGNRVIDLPVKGRGGTKTKRFIIPPYASVALDAYLVERGAKPGPLFSTSTGRPIDQPYVYRLVRRIAKAAGVPQWESLSPHSVRHSIATYLLEQHPLHVVQDLLGHADPRTTRRYDRARGLLDRSPAYALGAAFAQGEAQHLKVGVDG
ncbi:tyrosine-type recombinase/integrase [Nonomuraea rhodomycinica]|uniref:Tyrosine-type recombinase/integrase n=1 Tax=Nonomuraea rhodomycinica TaxID=1712872 RepID=A0A7Y6IW96_9ACTN|nr:tyrosine-type recombinase/integrase [Nonomuraea rhodomycinica]NUW45566.1 tyrosine-type recombinase/integrase [Nonomuraea rhodomycinica]